MLLAAVLYVSRGPRRNAVGQRHFPTQHPAALTGEPEIGVGRLSLVIHEHAGTDRRIVRALEDRRAFVDLIEHSLIDHRRTRADILVVLRPQEFPLQPRY